MEVRQLDRGALAAEILALEGACYLATRNENSRGSGRNLGRRPIETLVSAGAWTASEATIQSSLQVPLTTGFGLWNLVRSCGN